MKHSLRYATAITLVGILGSFYFSSVVEAEGTQNQPVAPSSSTVRYATEALQDTGSAVLCGDMGTSSSSNLNSLLSAVGRSFSSMTVRPMESVSGVCVFLSR